MLVVLAVTVISAEPLKLTPLILRAVCNVVAVAALPEQDAAVVALVALVAFVTKVLPIPATISAAVAAVNALVPFP